MLFAILVSLLFSRFYFLSVFYIRKKEKKQWVPINSISCTTYCNYHFTYMNYKKRVNRSILYNYRHKRVLMIYTSLMSWVLKLIIIWEIHSKWKEESSITSIDAFSPNIQKGNPSGILPTTAPRESYSSVG